MVAQQHTQDVILDSSKKLPVVGSSENELASSSEQPKGMDFGPILRALRRNLLLIAGVALVVTVPAFFGGKGSRTYQGSFRILVEPVTSQGRSTDPSAISRAQSGGEVNTIDYATLLQVLQSPSLLTKIAEQIRSRYPDVTADLLIGEIFAKNLVVKRVGETDYFNAAKLIDVAYKGPDAQRVQFILEELSKGFLKYSLEERRSRIGGGVEFIEDQLPALQRRVNSLEAELQAIKERYRLIDPASEGTAISQQLQQAKSQQLATQQELREQQTLYSRFQSQLNLTPDEASIAEAFGSNPRYQELLSETKKLEAQVAVKSARFNEGSPVIQALQDQQKNLVQLLEEETRKYLNQQFSVANANPRVFVFQSPSRLEMIRQLISTTTTMQLLQVRYQSISETTIALDQRLQQFPALVRQYNNLQQQLDIATKTLTQFLTQRETLRIEAAQKELPWETISPPKLIQDARGNPVPIAADSSKKLMTQLAIGVALGLAAAFLKEKLTNIFYNSEDIQSAAKAPLLSVIPFKESLSSSSISQVIAAEDAFLKSFSSLYTNLRFLRPSPVRSLVIGSAEAGDGKTTVALYLAIAAAALGQRVLLVDTNLRSPQIHALLGLPNLKGMSDVLTNDALEWQDAVQQSSLDKNLSIVTSGQVGRDSAKLLASSKMQNLMSQFQNAFDLVIYDTPNLVEFADTNFLASQTSGVVMLASIRKTKCPNVKKVISEFKKFRIPLLGVVSNNTKNKKTTTFSEQGKNRAYEELYERKRSTVRVEELIQPSSSSIPTE